MDKRHDGHAWTKIVTSHIKNDMSLSFCTSTCVGHLHCENQDCEYTSCIHHISPVNEMEWDGFTPTPFATVGFGRMAWRTAIRPTVACSNRRLEGGRPLCPQVGMAVGWLADIAAVRLPTVGRSGQPLIRWLYAMPFAQADHRVESPSAGGRHGGRCIRMGGRPDASGRTSLDVIFPEDVQSDFP
jgi:hypothetical protein